MSSSLKELKGLREAVLAEEKARTQALLQNLPDGPSDLQSEPASVPEMEESIASETEVSEPGIVSPLPSPPPPPPPNAQPTIARAGVPRPIAPTVNRQKPGKEPALIIPLTPKINERLQRNVEDARWSPSELVMEIIRVTLHQGYPAVQFGDQLIAKLGTYRVYERNPLETSLKIISGQGIFSVSVKPQNSEYQHWLAYFAEQKVSDPEKSAQQICLYGLQAYLENMEDFKPEVWLKNISSEAFSITSPS